MNNKADNKIQNKIGILGGTFNPIHNGHLILAQNALEYCDLDKILIMPSGISYLKDPSLIVSKEHRINMVKEAIRGNDKFELSLIETNRAGNSYTCDTLTELKKSDPDSVLYFIIGADTLFNIEYWKNPQIIFDNCIIVCTCRDHVANESLVLKRDKLISKYNANVIIMDYPDIDISSTFIREKISTGKNAQYYLQPSVWDYILKHNLYK